LIDLGVLSSALYQKATNIDLTDENDAYYAAQVVKKVAGYLGFSEYSQSMTSMAVSELALNAVRHGFGGSCSVCLSANRKGIVVQIEDSGPGIPSLEEAFKDGFSTYPYGSLGLGLGVAKRAVQELTIIKNDESGFKVRVEQYLPVTSADIDVAAISFTSLFKDINGDVYVDKNYDGDSVISAIINSQGDDEVTANSVSELAGLIRNNYRLPINELTFLCYRKINKIVDGNKVGLTILRVTSKKIVFTGIGDVHAYSDESSGMVFPVQDTNSVVDSAMDINVTEYLRPSAFTVILLSSGFLIESYGVKMIEGSTAFDSAKSIFDKYSIENYDSTIVVIKG
jgi:serine/threonine-protein kinase RsbT